MIRQTLDDTLLEIAASWARRGTCARAEVGAVLVLDGRTLASGYNGAPTGMAHCACRSSDYHVEAETCQVAVHAEVNAIAWAARRGVATDGSTLYTTLMPCLSCAKLLINAGVVRVVAARHYRLPDGENLLRDAGVEVECREMRP